MRTIAAGKFKANCLAIMDEVQKKRETVLITKRGKPVAMLSPLRNEAAHRSIIGAMKGTVSAYDDPFSPVGDPQVWDAAR